MLKNDALVAKFGVDTAENEPSKVWWFGWEKGSISNFSIKGARQFQTSLQILVKKQNMSLENGAKECIV